MKRACGLDSRQTFYTDVATHTHTQSVIRQLMQTYSVSHIIEYFVYMSNGVVSGFTTTAKFEHFQSPEQHVDGYD